MSDLHATRSRAAIEKVQREHQVTVKVWRAHPREAQHGVFRWEYECSCRRGGGSAHTAQRLGLFIDAHFAANVEALNA